MLRTAKRVNGRIPMFAAAIGGGVVVGGLFAVGRGWLGESLVIGPGYPIVAWAGDPKTSAWMLASLLALRCLATSATVAGGGVGGLFVPLVVGGALTGGLVGHVFNRQDLTLFIVIGVAAFLGAGYRVPLAGVMFVAETTGRPSFVVPGLLAAVAAELVMGRSSVTDYQMDPEEAMSADRPHQTDTSE
jgi:CIC family chloride channel protein